MAVPQDNVLDKNAYTNKSDEKRVAAIRNGVIVIALAVSLIGLYYLSTYSFLLFHNIVEVFSIVIALAIFVITWNTRHITDNNFFLFIGIAFVFVAGLNLFHTLAYKGMGVFPGFIESNLATQLWIVTRYMLSFTFLLPLVLFNRRVKPKVIFAGYTIATGLILFSIFFWQNFPIAYDVNVQSLTTFKVASEYTISIIILFAIGLLIIKRKEFSDNIFKLLLVAMFLAVATEMTFTLYTDVFGLANIIGHLLNVLSFYLIYRALVQTNLKQPYETLFRNLKQSETNLANRAEELTQVNQRLKEEIDQREATEEVLRESEEQLQEYSSQMEELAEERASQLKNAERLSAIGATAGMVGHDIRNPLQAITSELYLERLEIEDLHDDAAKRNLLESILSVEENIVYINKIVADLQDFAKPLNPKKEPVDIEKSIKETLAMVQIPPTIKYTISIKENLPPLTADSTMIKRVLVNLTQNAVQAIPNGGDLKISAAKRNDKIVISVEDNGEGIPTEMQTKLFTPLMTTKAKGQGFGLAVVKRMTEAMGGTVSFETQQGKGTKFILQFPV